MKSIEQLRVQDMSTGALTYFEHNGERFVRVSEDTYRYHEILADRMDTLVTHVGTTHGHTKVFARHYKYLYFGA